MTGSGVAQGARLMAQGMDEWCLFIFPSLVEDPEPVAGMGVLIVDA